MELNRAGLSALLPDGTCAQLVQDWLREDCPSFDYGGFVVGDGVREARLLGKSRGILAGVPFFEQVFRQLDCKSRTMLDMLREAGYSNTLAGTRKTTPGFRLVEKCVVTAKAVGGFSIKIEVECQTLAEADEAINAGADIVMLDNFSSDNVRAAAATLKARSGRRALIEISGGLTVDNVKDYACNGE
ncbi:MAG: hypothetical protein M1815_002019 [Lichina confinis]|nr:MAG: hypothetical protein M1815_002019 [Lichina confinis]